MPSEVFFKADADIEWEETDREIEKYSMEVEYWAKQVEAGAEWVFLLMDVETAILAFKENMDSLCSAFSVMEDRESNSNEFLRGTILVGVVSAYESFVRDLFISMLENPNISINVDGLSNKDREYLRAKKCESIDDFKKAISRATLHEPNQIARVAYGLFGIALPHLPDELCEKLLRIRNDYSHNGGMSNGKKHVVSASMVYEIFDFVFGLVSVYNDSLLREADSFFENNSDEANCNP